MERNDQLKNFKKNVLDTVSPTVCSAKWLEATMWLYDGVTASCHHNPTHKIQLDPNDPSSLHNTAQKINERKAMLAGDKPNGCNYCWNTEDAGSISDRYRKSFAHKTSMLLIPMEDEKHDRLTDCGERYIKHSFSDVTKASPIHLEIAFSRVCNLGCMYCGPYFSNTWANDIRVNGPYNVRPNTSHDTRFEDPLTHIKDDEDNPYIKAFFDWWPTIKKTLSTLRFTGGEPFLHKGMWKFLEEAVDDPEFDGDILINSNLIHNEKIIKKFIELSSQRIIPRVTHKGLSFDKRSFEIHTSCESSLIDSEYTRDGFDGQIWWNNVNLLLSSLPNLSLTITTAINNVGVWSYNQYIDMIIDLRKKYGKDKIRLNANRVFHPTYQSISLIDYDRRLTLKKMLIESREKLLDSGMNNPYDFDQLDSLIQYTGDLHSSSNTIEEEKALLVFLSEYNTRRNKNEDTLSPGFRDWIKSVRGRHEQQA
jgi:hypothetical protein